MLVIGHKNPDTDSICAAIAYSRLKSKVTGDIYLDCRAGHLNEETQYVLDKLGVEEPAYIKDVRTQVRDMEIKMVAGVSRDISMKAAWKIMRDEDVVTLAVTQGKALEGVITMGDIVESYMDLYDSKMLSMAKTSYQNVVDSLAGTMVVGEIDDCIEKGKVLIAAGNPEEIEKYVEPGDVVILGNRYESQLCAIEMDAGCLIVCEGSSIASTIKKQADEHGCKIISTPHDTFTAARLINQSLPISYFMKEKNLVTFRMNDYIEDIQAVMAKEHHRYFPVLDDNDRYVGMISRRNFLGARKKRVILVDHNEKSQAVNGIENAEIMEIIDHHRLGTIETMGPVFFRNQPLGSTSTIVYLMYQEYNVEIDKNTAGLLLAAIVSDTLLYRSPTCTEVDRKAGAALAEISGIDPEKFAMEMFRAGSNLGSKTADEIIHQDFKRFSVNDMTIGIGQISSMDAEELKEIEKRVAEELENQRVDNKLDMIFILFTDILSESSEVFFTGKDADVTIENAFNGKKTGENSALLPGVVSRKKQFLPAVVSALQQ